MTVAYVMHAIAHRTLRASFVAAATVAMISWEEVSGGSDATPPSIALPMSVVAIAVIAPWTKRVDFDNNC